ncbi:MAG: DUF4830 domain-containing protein [Clostridiales bacterium]|nr:DUF4830 domain-containing protein [Clostridiales bacterium]
MFVLSVKSSKIKVWAIGVAAIACICGVTLLAINHRADTVSKNEGLVVRGATSQEREAFLAQFGWTVNPEPLEVTEIMIPAEFDEVYNEYNKIQLAQQFDLSKYCSKRVKRWTYEITNYPGYTAGSGCIRANLLVFDGQIIGGDVCSVELNGFMHGFEKLQ